MRHGDLNEVFVSRHLDSAMELATALYYKDDITAEDAMKRMENATRQDFLTLALELRRLIETAVRDHMTFLLPSVASTEAIKTRQSTFLQSLPDTCHLRFRQLLELQWNGLTHAATSATFSLPRVQQLDWKVAVESKAGKHVVVRLQTTDGETRTIRVPMQQFHQLRHSVATVLQEMNEVETHPLRRLAHMEQTAPFSTVS